MVAKRKWVSVAIVVAGVVAVLTVISIGSAVFMFSRYVRTDEASEQTAVAEFEKVLGRFAGQQALVEFRPAQAPVVHRNPSAPRQELHTLHALVYDADEGHIRRVDAPSTVLQVVTLGGLRRFMGVGMLGDDGDRITLEDLERHGPGLVLDMRGSGAWQFAVSDALAGTNAQSSRLLIWTD